MAGPLLYRPMPKWHVWAALSAAAAIHIGAAVIAGIQPKEEAMNLDLIPDAIVMATVESEPEPMPTPPPEEPEPMPPPPEPKEEPEFKEEQATPPPRPRPQKPVAPIAKPKAVGVPGPQSTSGKANMIYKPQIQYPYEARKARATGSGVVVMNVDLSSGAVTSATMGSSTGNPILDNAAVTGMRKARFKPGTGPLIKTPITFTLTGATF